MSLKSAPTGKRQKRVTYNNMPFAKPEKRGLFGDVSFFKFRGFQPWILIPIHPVRSGQRYLKFWSLITHRPQMDFAFSAPFLAAPKHCGGGCNSTRASSFDFVHRFQQTWVEFNVNLEGGIHNLGCDLVRFHDPDLFAQSRRARRERQLKIRGCHIMG